MDELERKYALIYADIAPSTHERGVQCFQEELLKSATAMVDQITSKRDELRSGCQTKRQELADLARDLDIETGAVPDIVPPYEPLHEMLTGRVNELHTMMTARDQKITSYFDEATEIATALDLKKPPMPPNYHLSSIESLKQQLQLLRAERDNRFERLAHLMDTLTPLYQELEFDGIAGLLHEDPFKNLDLGLLKQLEQEVSELHKLREERQAQIESLKTEITELSGHLCIRQKFTTQLGHSYLEELAATRDDLSRKLQAKIAELIQDAKVQYSDFCTRLSIEPQEFGSSTIQTYEIIVAENKRLGKLIEQRESIDSSYAELQNLKVLEKKLEEAAKNPERFKQRGQVLIQENRQRSHLMVRKPAILRKLQKLLADWRAASHPPILFDGEELTQILAKEMARDSRKPSARAARAARVAINDKSKPKPTQRMRIVNKAPAPVPVRSAKPDIPASTTHALKQSASTRPKSVGTNLLTKTVKSPLKSPLKPRISSRPSSKPLQSRSGIKVIPSKSTPQPISQSRDRLTGPQRPNSSQTRQALAPLPIQNNHITPKSPEKQGFVLDLPSEMTSLMSAGNACTPSAVSKRDCCDRLRYEPKRTVKIPTYDPDYSAIDATMPFSTETHGHEY